MIALIQRVTRASVAVNDEQIASIGPGLLALIGVQQGDGPAQARRLAQRLLSYRVFADTAGKMNLSLLETGGALLLVPQFTLAADTRKGNRASFTRAADPATGRQLFELLAGEARRGGTTTATGQFGADMQVSLTNDGPVTFWLEVPGGREL